MKLFFIQDPFLTGIENVPILLEIIFYQLSLSFLSSSYFCVVVIWLDAILRKSIVRKSPWSTLFLILGFASVDILLTLTLTLSSYLTDNRKLFDAVMYIHLIENVTVVALFIVGKEIFFFFFYLFFFFF